MCLGLFQYLIKIRVYDFHNKLFCGKIRIDGAVVFGGIKRVFHKLRVYVFSVSARPFEPARRGKVVDDISAVKRFCLVKKRFYTLVPSRFGLIFEPVKYNELRRPVSAILQRRIR